MSFSKPSPLISDRSALVARPGAPAGRSGGRLWFDPSPWRARLGLPAVAGARGEPDPLKQAWCEYLAGWPFDLWVARADFRRARERGKGRLDSLDPESARAAFGDLKGFIHRKTGHWPFGALVLDYGARGDRLHLHALLARCGGVRRLSVMDFWHSKFGTARVQAYDPRRGARGYLSGKYLSAKVEIEFV